MNYSGKYLVTSDNWFFAPDGKQYKSAWGEVSILEDNFLGIKTNRNSANWFLKIGSDSKFIIIAGCQIHYAVKCENKPNDGEVQDWKEMDNEVIQYHKPSSIYIAE